MDEDKDLMNKNTDAAEAKPTADADGELHTESEIEGHVEQVGDIRLADEVISIVASLAAQEVAGVLGMSGSFADGINHFLGKENASKGVRISYEGPLVNVKVYVNVEYGSCIPEIALEIQEKVKEAIEKMTGYEVQFVDVHVQGVAKRRKTDLEKEAEARDAASRSLLEQHEDEAAELRHKKFFEED